MRHASNGEVDAQIRGNTAKFLKVSECYSHPWCGSRPHCRVLCQTLACRPHESSKCGAAALSWRGSTSRLHYRDLAHGRCFCCFPMPRFFVNASPKVHHGASAPLESGKKKKNGAAGLKHLPFLLDRCCWFTNLLKRKQIQLRRSVKLHTDMSLTPLVLASLSGAARPKLGVTRMSHTHNWPCLSVQCCRLEAETPPTHTGNRQAAKVPSFHDCVHSPDLFTGGCHTCDTWEVVSVADNASSLKQKEEIRVGDLAIRLNATANPRSGPR